MNKTKLTETWCHVSQTWSIFPPRVMSLTGLTQFLLEHTERWALVPSWDVQGHLSPFSVPCVRQATLVQGRMLYWSARTVITKYHRLGALNPHRLTFSQFWRLEAQDRGVVSRLRLQTPLSLACRCHSLAACSHGYACGRAHPCSLFLFL